jgi:SAM-dependent methyltransferase
VNEITKIAAATGQATSDEELRRLALELDIAVWTDRDVRTSRWRRIARAARESTRDRLPVRYATDTWHVPFRSRLATALRPGIRILDVGAGARPTVAVEDRPADCTYVGFDVAADELLKAPPGSYDHVVVGDVCRLRNDLLGRFDLVVSWLAMEHVKPVPTALLNLSRYQTPGGRFLAYLSGTFSVHALLNRVVPAKVAKVAMRQLLGREPDTVFQAHYDRCWYTALANIAREAWSEAEVVPLFTGGWYFRFSPRIRAPFLAYEEWAYSGGHRNLAAYYLIDATA